MYNTAKQIPALRKHMNYYQLNKIVHKRCLHIDVFLTDDSEDVLRFELRTSIGGFKELTRRYWRVDSTGWRVDGPSAYTHSTIQRYINGRFGKARPWLQRAHRELILPLVTAPLSAPFVTRSVRLHYVTQRACALDPTAGAVNMYGHTGRADRDAALASGEQSIRDQRRERGKAKLARAHLGDPVPAASEPIPALDTRTRSVLRSLDKLLRG